MCQSLETARFIYQRVMEELQAAEEIGSPELPEYIRLMHSIEQDVARRIDVATDRLINELKEGL